MKSTILTAVMFLSFLATAGATEPGGTLSAATVKIGGLNFLYVVENAGIRRADLGASQFVSTKTYVLNYRALDDKGFLPASIRTDLNADSASRCRELGDNEIAEQSKKAPKNSTLRLNTAIASSRIDEKMPITGTFFCSIEVASEVTK